MKLFSMIECVLAIVLAPLVRLTIIFSIAEISGIHVEVWVQVIYALVPSFILLPPIYALVGKRVGRIILATILGSVLSVSYAMLVMPPVPMEDRLFSLLISGTIWATVFFVSTWVAGVLGSVVENRLNRAEGIQNT